MDYIDRKYLLLASGYLQGWKDMGQDRFNCRCPICGDSQKNKHKRRGYFFTHDGGVVYKCHNCGVSKGLQGFLNDINPELAQQYRMDKFMGAREEEKTQEESRIRSQFHVDTSRLTRARNVLDDLEPISALDEFHPVRRYLEGRKIPAEFMKDLRLVPNIQSFITRLPGYEETKMPAKAAVAIPFFDDSKNLLYIQFRLMDHPALRYFTADIAKSENKIWGLDRVDWNRRVYVCEGPLDAMFMDNGLAVAGASVLSIRKYLQQRCQKGYTLVFDRDYIYNAEIFALLSQAINENESVVLYDRSVVGKDINDIVMEKNWSRQELMKYLEAQTKTGLAAKLELSSFKPPQKDTTAWRANRVVHR